MERFNIGNCYKKCNEVCSAISSWSWLSLLGTETINLSCKVPFSLRLFFSGVSSPLTTFTLNGWIISFGSDLTSTFLPSKCVRVFFNLN